MHKRLRHTAQRSKRYGQYAQQFDAERMIYSSHDDRDNHNDNVNEDDEDDSVVGGFVKHVQNAQYADDGITESIMSFNLAPDTFGQLSNVNKTSDSRSRNQLPTDSSDDSSSDSSDQSLEFTTTTMTTSAHMQPTTHNNSTTHASARKHNKQQPIATGHSDQQKPNTTTHNDKHSKPNSAATALKHRPMTRRQSARLHKETNVDAKVSIPQTHEQKHKNKAVVDDHKVITGVVKHDAVKHASSKPVEMEAVENKRKHRSRVASERHVSFNTPKVRKKKTPADVQKTRRSTARSVLNALRQGTIPAYDSDMIDGDGRRVEPRDDVERGVVIDKRKFTELRTDSPGEFQSANKPPWLPAISAEMIQKMRTWQLQEVLSELDMRKNNWYLLALTVAGKLLLPPQAIIVIGPQTASVQSVQPSSMNRMSAQQNSGANRDTNMRDLITNLQRQFLRQQQNGNASRERTPNTRQSPTLSATADSSDELTTSVNNFNSFNSIDDDNDELDGSANVIPFLLPPDPGDSIFLDQFDNVGDTGRVSTNDIEQINQTPMLSSNDNRIRQYDADRNGLRPRVPQTPSRPNNSSQNDGNNDGDDNTVVPDFVRQSDARAHAHTTNSGGRFRELRELVMNETSGVTAPNAPALDYRQPNQAAVSHANAWISRPLSTGVFYLNPNYVAARDAAYAQISSRADQLASVPMKYFARKGRSGTAQFRVFEQFASLIAEMYRFSAHKSNRSSKLASDAANLAASIEQITLFFSTRISFDRVRCEFKDAGANCANQALNNVHNIYHDNIPWRRPIHTSNALRAYKRHNPLLVGRFPFGPLPITRHGY